MCACVRAWVGVKFPQKKCYVPLEWPHIAIKLSYLTPSDDDDLIERALDDCSRTTRSIGSVLYLQQFMAILVKRFHYTRRNWKGLFSQILLPALFVCIAMTVALTAPQNKDLPPMVLSPAQYYNSTQPRGKNNNNNNNGDRRSLFTINVMNCTMCPVRIVS